MYMCAWAGAGGGQRPLPSPLAPAPPSSPCGPGPALLPGFPASQPFCPALCVCKGSPLPAALRAEILCLQDADEMPCSP